MAFSITSRNIGLSGTILFADCQRHHRDGYSWKSSWIDLNDILGSVDGSFRIGRSNFSATARFVQLRGTILCAELLKYGGQSTSWATIDLNLFIENSDGNLRYKRLHESILMSCSMFTLEQAFLTALCLADDGMFHLSEINLNDYYANVRGSFESGGNHFYYTARNTTLDVSSSSVLLRSELEYRNGSRWMYRPAEVDLAICIINNNGSLTFVKHDGWFDRDGFFAKLFEPIPVAGFIVAGLHALAGNEDHAQRALALCTNSSIVMSGITIGLLFGGALGAVIGAGMITPIGIITEKFMSGAIHDPRIMAQFEEATIGRYIYETLRNMVAAGAAAKVGIWLGSISAEWFEAVSFTICREIGRYAVRKGGSTGTSVLLKKLSDALTREVLPEEWEVLRS